MRTLNFITNLPLLLITITIVSCKNGVPATFNQTEPANGVVELSWNPKFIWETSDSATTFSIIIATNKDYTNPVVDIKNLKDTNYTPGVFFKGGIQYYWKVTAHNIAGSTIATNSGMSFTTSIEPSPGNTYHVATTGVDNPGNGTVKNPFKTLAYACNQAIAKKGKFIYVHAGTYRETEPAIVPLGVNIIGEGEAKTILSSKGVMIPEDVDPENISVYKEQYHGSLIQLISEGSIPGDGDQVLSGFTIDGNSKSLKAGVWVQNRSGVKMHHVTIKECDYRGAVIAGGYKDYSNDEAWLEDIKIYNCTIVNSARNIYEVNDPSKLVETLGNLCIGGLDGAEIYNITINDNVGYGIKFTLSGYYKNTKIHDCNILLSESVPQWREAPAIELWEMGPGNEIYNIQCNTWLSLVNHPGKFVDSDNMKVYNVTMKDLDGSSMKEAIEILASGVEVYNSYFENKGFGIAIWYDGPKNITIRNNIFYNSKEQSTWGAFGAVYIDNSVGTEFSNINIYNNVFDTYKYGISIITSNSGSAVKGVNVSNNAFLNVSEADIFISGDNISNINVNHNLKYNTIVKDWIFTGAVSQSNNIKGDPGFTQIGERWDTYYRPKSASSLVVDKGADVGLSFNETAPDIGRFEYGKEIY